MPDRGVLARLSAFLVVAITALPAVSPAHAQRPARQGWYFSIRLGGGYARAACDTPCRAPRTRWGPHYEYSVGHSLGDRATLALALNLFGGPNKKSKSDDWVVGGVGLELAGRPSPTDWTSASAMLGPGVLDWGTADGLPRRSAAIALWDLAVAYDDPTRSGVGACASAYGTAGGVVTHWSLEDAGRRVGAAGISAGAFYVRR